MASPLSIFRKYQKSFLAVFGVMLMFAFVIGPTLNHYFRANLGGGTRGNQAAVAWKYGEITDADLAQMRTSHLMAMQFLQRLVNQVEVTEKDVPATIDGKKVFLIEGKLYHLVGLGTTEGGERTYRIVVSGQIVEIPESAASRISPKVQIIQQVQTEQELVRKMVLAQKAELLGVVISDEAITEYLDNLCDSTSKPNYGQILAESTRGKMNVAQLMAQLHHELLAQRMLLMSQSGFYSAPPQELFSYYNRLNRRVTAELFPVRVADFVDEVSEPSEKEIQAMYEEGKDRFPLSSSPDPGFKHRQKIAFGYFKGVFDDFLALEMDKIRPTITDEQVEKYYEENKDSKFKTPELPPAEDPADGEDAPDDPMADSQAASDEAADSPGPDATPVPEKPAEEKPAEEKPAKQDEPETPEQPESDQSMTEQSEMEAFVSLVDDEPDETPAAEESGETPADDPKPEAGETPAAEPAEKDDAPAAVAPETGADGEAESTAEEKPAKKPAPSYQPLDDELRQQIREDLARQQARPIASKKFDDSISAARDKVREYARELLRARQLGSDDSPEPEPLDFKAVAEENGLTYQETPLVDIIDVIDLQRSEQTDASPAYRDFATATESGWDQRARQLVQRTIADVAFGGNTELYTPRRILDGFSSQDIFNAPPTAVYLYWRIEEQAEFVPELDEIRQDVIAACKQRSALPLAKAKAEELAKSAGEQVGKSLTELFAKDADQVIVTNEFSWLTVGAVAMGGGGMPTLSQVTGTVNEQPTDVPGAGSDFMKAVFEMKVDQVGAAVNQPQTVVFVARVVKEAMSDEDRRELFFVGGLNRQVQTVMRIEQMERIGTWYDDLEKEFQVEYERDLSRPWSTE